MPFDLGVLTPEQRAQFDSLNAQFRSQFGSENFGDFDINAFQTDAAYRNNVIRTAGQRGGDVGGRVQALNNILSFVSSIPPGQGPGNGFTQVDPTADFANQRTAINKQFGEFRAQIPEFFDKSRANVATQAGLAETKGTLQINQNFQGAAERGSEAAAAAGLGRSGVNLASQLALRQEQAQTRSNLNAAIAEREAALSAGIDDAESNLKVQVAQQELAANLQLDFQEMSFNLEQDLREQGWDQQMISDRISFERELFRMNFAAELQFNLDQANQGNWFTDIAPLIGTAIGLFGSGPAGAAVGSVLDPLGFGGDAHKNLR